MPTIPQLPTATQTDAQDEVPISQGGVTRAVTVAELLSGTQPLIETSSPTLLGRASLGPGSPEALAIGSGLGIQGTTVVANGGDHSSFPQESSFAAIDEVIVNAAGMPRRLPIPALRTLFSAGTNVSIATTGVVSASTDPNVTGTLNSLAQGVTAAQANIAVLSSKIPVGGFVSLNSNGQITAPVAGDVSAATVLAAGSATTRTLATRAADVINLLDFGATPGGADCSAAFSAAFAKLPTAGGELFIPAGDYWLLSPMVFPGKAVSIRGAGRGQTRVHFQHMGIGFDFAPGSLFNKVLLQGLSLYAESLAGQTTAAVRVTYSPTSTFGYVSVSIDEVEFFGYPNSSNGASPFPQTFLRGLILNNCWSSQISSISWFGPPSAPGTTTSAVVEINGSIDTRLTGIQAYYGNTVILQTGYCEGVYLSNPLVVGADYLFLQTDETKWNGYVVGRPMLLGLWVNNGEVNTNLGTVQLANVTDGFLANLDITRDGGPNTSQVLFNLNNVSNFHVSGCNFVGGPSGGNNQDIAFQFKSTFNSSSNILDGCHFENMATVIQIIGSNGTVGLTTTGLHLSNVPMSTAILDSTTQEVGNYLTFTTPPQPGVPAGLGNTKDHVLASSLGSVLFRVNNVPAATNFIRHQPATTGNSPTICFDGSDNVVNGVVQTKGGNFLINAAGGMSGSGNLATFLNTPNAANWIVMQNAIPGSLSLLGTNSGGLGVQPKGALWLTPNGGLFIPGLPTVKPTVGSGQVWNNSGVLSIA